MEMIALIADIGGREIWRHLTEARKLGVSFGEADSFILTLSLSLSLFHSMCVEPFL